MKASYNRLFTDERGGSAIVDLELPLAVDFADMKADIDFCRYGPGTAVVIAQVSLARRKADINAGLPEEGRHRLPSSGRYVISELREMSII